MKKGPLFRISLFFFTLSLSCVTIPSVVSSSHVPYGSRVALVATAYAQIARPSAAINNTSTVTATRQHLERTNQGRPSCRCVAFRLDDVGDSNYPEMEHTLLNIFKNSNTSLTVGIIGNRFGNNTSIVSQLSSMLKANTPARLEVANHGWNHEDFSALSLQKQIGLMQKTNEKIYRILGISPTVFIAPFNKINNSTYLAAKDNGMYSISANPNTDPPSLATVSPDSAGMYHLPVTTITAHLSKDRKHWVPRHLSELENEILNGLQKNGYAVVEMHPQEFKPINQSTSGQMIDDSHLADIESLIEWLHSQKIETVTMGSFASLSTSVVPEFPSSLFASSTSTTMIASTTPSLIAAAAIVSTIVVLRMQKKFFF